MMEGRGAVAETAAAHWRAEEMADVGMLPSVSALGDWDLPSTLRNIPRELTVSQGTVRPPRMTLNAYTLRRDSKTGQRGDGETSRAGLDLLHEPASHGGFFSESKVLSLSFTLDSFDQDSWETGQPDGCQTYVMVAPNLETSVKDPDATSHDSRSLSYPTLGSHSLRTPPKSAFSLSPLSSDITTSSNRTTSPTPLPTHRPRYRCREPKCQKTYAGSSERSRHEKRHNRNTSAWKCPASVCVGKRCGRRDNCLKHIRKYHPELAAAGTQPIEVPII